MKKILPFTGQLDLQAGAEAADDDVDDMIQRLDMAMQVQVLLHNAIKVPLSSEVMHKPRKNLVQNYVTVRLLMC